MRLDQIEPQQTRTTQSKPHGEIRTETELLHSAITRTQELQSALAEAIAPVCAAQPPSPDRARAVDSVMQTKLGGALREFRRVLDETNTNLQDMLDRVQL